MKLIYLVVILLLILSTTILHSQIRDSKEMKSSINEIILNDIDGKSVKLSDYKGKVLLIVNVASYCGYTKQYVGLEQIYKEYKDKGFEILAFPCNQFAEQEPGTNEEIKNFCSSKFDVSFKLFDKIEKKKKNQSPL